MQAGGGDVFRAAAIVHLVFAGAPFQAAGGFQFQLARRIIAGMAGHAFLFQYGFDIAMKLKVLHQLLRAGCLLIGGIGILLVLAAAAEGQ